MIVGQPRRPSTEGHLRHLQQERCGQRVAGEDVEEQDPAQEQRDAQEDLADAAEQRVQPAGTVAGDDADERAENRHEQAWRRYRPGSRPGPRRWCGRIRRSPGRPGRTRRRATAPHEPWRICGVRVGAGEQLGKRRHEDEEHDQRRRDPEHRPVAELVPGVGPSDRAFSPFWGHSAAPRRPGRIGGDRNNGLGVQGGVAGRVSHERSSGPGSRTRCRPTG